jgi:hypothetical protein
MNTPCTSLFIPENRAKNVDYGSEAVRSNTVERIMSVTYFGINGVGASSSVHTLFVNRGLFP